MKKLIQTFTLIFVISFSAVPRSYAFTVHDPVNTAVNTLRNAILESKWLQQIQLAFERLNELRTQTLEIFRFHEGLDDIIDSVLGDPLGDLLGQGSLRDAFIDAGLITPQIEIGGGAGTPQDIRSALEAATGTIPEGNLRSFIPFEEAQVVDAFYLANQIRESGGSTREAADKIANQAKEASPKGAARLQAQGVAQLMKLEQQNQEVMAKLLELTATQVEQVSRVEKEIEHQRIKYLDDSNEYLEGYFASL